MAKRKHRRRLRTLIPNDFRDFLSLISIIGFLGIFIEFVFEKSFINDNITSFFLILGGFAFMVIGKIFKINVWIRDGLQRNEILQVTAGILGGLSVIAGVMLFFDKEPFLGKTIIGAVALIVGVIITIDYIAKNKKRR